MGQGATPETWSTCQGWGWKKEDSIKKEEDLENKDRKLREKHCSNKNCTFNQIQKKYIQELTSSDYANDDFL